MVEVERKKQHLKAEMVAWIQRKNEFDDSLLKYKNPPRNPHEKVAVPEEKHVEPDDTLPPAPRTPDPRGEEEEIYVYEKDPTQGHNPKVMMKTGRTSTETHLRSR